MALINRITRLFRTDMHAVLDRLEEPQSLLRQSVREMEEAIAQERTQLKLLEHELARTGKRREALSGSMARAEDEIGTCLDAGNDELARRFVRRKLETERALSHLAEHASDIGERIERARGLLATHGDQLESMQQKLKLLAPDTIRDPGDEWAAGVTDEDVEVALLREKQGRAS